MRLIDADALLEEGKNTSEFQQHLADEYDLECIIKGAPTIEAEPVRHGEREIVDATSYDDICTCSECGGLLLRGLLNRATVRNAGRR